MARLRLRKYVLHSGSRSASFLCPAEKDGLSDWLALVTLKRVEETTSARRIT